MRKRDRAGGGGGEHERDDSPGAPSSSARPAAFNNPFAAALASHPVIAQPAEPAELPANAATKRVPAPARAVVRMERKGHGGKEVTVIEQLGLAERDLERWLKALKQTLGCGGRLDGPDIVLQGDHRATIGKLLEGRGVKKVTIG